MLCIVFGCRWLAKLWRRPRRIGVWCGVGLYNLNSVCDIIHGNGAPLNVVCNGPTPWQCSGGHLVCSAYDYVIFPLGVRVSVSLSAQSIGRRHTIWRGRNMMFSAFLVFKKCSNWLWCSMLSADWIECGVEMLWIVARKCYGQQSIVYQSTTAFWDHTYTSRIAAEQKAKY